MFNRWSRNAAAWLAAIALRFYFWLTVSKSSNLIFHAELEFKAAGYVKDGVWADEMQQLMCSQILELLKLFSTHGHSGFSASYALGMFQQLAKYEPLVPLTGEDWEWNEVGNGVYQNKRCSHVFRDRERFNGQAYDIDAIIFREPNGSCYTSSGSSQPITFPYTPTRVYKDVERVS